MIVDIPLEAIQPGDKVLVWDHGPPDQPFAEPVWYVMAASDGKFAVYTDPRRWSWWKEKLCEVDDAALTEPGTETPPAEHEHDEDDEDHPHRRGRGRHR